MATTPNYNLFITDDASTRFIDWRRELTGTSDSNMTKIDSALSEKAEKSSVLSSTLLVDSWTGEVAPFQQVISLPELTAEQNGVVSIANDATPEQRQAAMDASLFVIEQQKGVLMIGANYKKPGIDIPVAIILIN